MKGAFVEHKKAILLFATAFFMALTCLLMNNLLIHFDFNPAYSSNNAQRAAYKMLIFDPWVVDDAYISMRYAENFAQGKGLVYNEGEYVEGYTTLTWVVLLALVHKMGIELEVLPAILCFVFTVLTLALLFFTPRFIKDAPTYASALAALFLGTNGVFTVWALGSMEVPLAQFFILLSFLLHMAARDSQDHFRWNLASALLCVLVAMTRPEGVLIFLVYFLDRLWLSARDKNLSFFTFGFFFSMIFAPYLLWRFNYYGEWLPNTFYAKVGSNISLQARDGLIYFGRFCSNTLPIIAPVVAIALLGGNNMPLLKRFWAPIAACTVYIGFIVCAGGDYMPASRLFAPVLPILCLLSAIVLATFAQRPRQLLFAAVLVLAWNQVQFFTAQDMYTRTENGAVGRTGKHVGKWMRNTFPPDTLIATNTAGSIPFFSKLPTIDMLGLNDRHIAHREIRNMGAGPVGHEKGDGAYVLSRKPDYIQFASASGSAKPRFLGDREIFASSAFKKNYKLKSFRIPNGRSVLLYELIKKQPKNKSPN